jgi:hypothetical protein
MSGTQCGAGFFIKRVQRLANQVNLATAAIIQPG